MHFFLIINLRYTIKNQPAEVLGNVDSIDIDQHDIANETDLADSWVRYATHHRGGGRKDSSHP